MIHLYKNRGFWEVLEQIRALCANKDGHSYIHVAFRGLHSEKQPLEENTQKHIQNNHIQNNHTHLSFARKLHKEIKCIEGDQFIQGEFIEIVDTK